MRYRTCFGCLHEREVCPTRAALKENLVGLGVTSIKWKCKERIACIQPGDPVIVKTVPFYGQAASDEYGYDPFKDIPFPAVAIRPSGTKMIVYVQPGAGALDNSAYDFEGEGWCKVPLDRIQPREGPRYEICKACGEPPDALPNKCDPVPQSDGCLVQQRRDIADRVSCTILGHDWKPDLVRMAAVPSKEFQCSRCDIKGISHYHTVTQPTYPGSQLSHTKAIWGPIVPSTYVET